jgi:hypothetical protein
MKTTDLLSIGDIYGKMLNGVKHTILKEAKKQPPNAFNSKMPKMKTKDPEGVRKALNDSENKGDDEEDEQDWNTKPTPKSKRLKASETLEAKSKNPKLSPGQRKKLAGASLKQGFYAEHEEDLKESRKNNTETINKIMSKSTFDALYSKVLKENFGQQENDDLDALGLDDATPDTEMGDEFGAEDEFGDEGEGDTVTFTLDKSLAQALVDALQGVLGGEEDFGDEGEGDLDFGDEGEGGEDDFGGEGGFKPEEDEEGFGTKPAKDGKAAFQGKGSWKVSGPPQPKHSKASTAVTQDQGTKDGAPPITQLQGKDNKVKSTVKVGDYFK